MAGLHTNHRHAIMSVGNAGISFDTFENFEDLLKAAAYRFCAEKSGSVIELEMLTAEVVKDVQREWSEVPI